ncbi:translation initiation factor IF-2 [Candidatus Hepatobacter penaei]|uniref:translation initiation factor IF-2 n=1 Tax=Candidatus Hepatobacter penaei TaxID=1274402 RepID=UPI0006987D97|nr:translation initiation factor IF-2 [Candidatus Hepatobacter penaei]
MTKDDSESTLKERAKSLTLELSPKTRKRLDTLQGAQGARSRNVVVEVKRRRSRSAPPPPASEPLAKAPSSEGPAGRLTDQEKDARQKALKTALAQEKEKEKAPEVAEKPIPQEEVAHGPRSKDKKSVRHHTSPKTDNEDADSFSKKPARKKWEEKTAKHNLARLYEVEDTLPTSGEDEPKKVMRTPLRSHTRRQKVKTVQHVLLPEKITARELAGLMSEKLSAVLRAASTLDLTLTDGQSLDAHTAELIVLEMGHTCARKKTQEEELMDLEAQALAASSHTLSKRPPVVTIMGHVDHGKTSLLDAMRKTNVADKEAGGITQSIGAYQITLTSGEKITFIDTPGHEAFTHMRARGAHVTDIIILLVAADDGIMAQTIEAINHAKASQAPIIVAINKMDKPGAAPDQVKQALLSHDIVVESLGGDVLDVEISAKTGQNLDTLQEAILGQAELLELSGSLDAPAKGAVLECRQDKKRGTLATVLVQNGTLTKGDTFVAGQVWGRVRWLADDQGKSITATSLSQPVEILGLSEPAMAGDDFFVVKDEAQARDITRLRIAQNEEQESATGPLSLEQLIKGDNAQKELTVILKADTQGSLEAVYTALTRTEHPEVKVKVLHKGVGALTESDALLAKTSQALLLGFHMKPSNALLDMAQKLGVEVQTYDVIYHLIENVQDLMSGLLSPEKKEVILGHAQIRQVFVVKKANQIAGCYVTDGIVKRDAHVRVKRGDTVLHQGVIQSLRRDKNDVKDVREKYECGICIKNYNAFEIGDVLEVFEFKNVKRTLDL